MALSSQGFDSETKVLRLAHAAFGFGVSNALELPAIGVKKSVNLLSPDDFRWSGSSKSWTNVRPCECGCVWHAAFVFLRSSRLIGKVKI